MAEILNDNVFKSYEYEANTHQSAEHPVSVMSSLLLPPSAPRLHYMAAMGRLPRPKLKEEDQSP